MSAALVEALDLRVCARRYTWSLSARRKLARHPVVDEILRPGIEQYSFFISSAVDVAGVQGYEDWLLVVEDPHRTSTHANPCVECVPDEFGRASDRNERRPSHLIDLSMRWRVTAFWPRVIAASDLEATEDTTLTPVHKIGPVLFRKSRITRECDSAACKNRRVKTLNWQEIRFRSAGQTNDCEIVSRRPAFPPRPVGIYCKGVSENGLSLFVLAVVIRQDSDAQRIRIAAIEKDVCAGQDVVTADKYTTAHRGPFAGAHLDPAHSTEREHRRAPSREYFRKRHRGHDGRRFAQEILRGRFAIQIHAQLLLPLFSVQRRT